MSQKITLNNQTFFGLVLLKKTSIVQFA